MKGLPRITEIIKVEPFKVTVRWTTGEVRVIDFNDLLTSWGVAQDKDSDLSGLYEYEVFRYVSIAESKTLQWPTILLSHLTFDEIGTAAKTTSPLLLDPDVLYEASRPIEEYRLVPISEESLARAA